ncbi:hypothetical protein EDB83DRAFT_2319054 [Lactarius deliciosus]|nr:hypothetical protein EDB83DRAFT_2319054 [Lactarius deliciosus]
MAHPRDSARAHHSRRIIFLDTCCLHSDRDELTQRRRALRNREDRPAHQPHRAAPFGEEPFAATERAAMARMASSTEPQHMRGGSRSGDIEVHARGRDAIQARGPRISGSHSEQRHRWSMKATGAVSEPRRELAPPGRLFRDLVQRGAPTRRVSWCSTPQEAQCRC